jgi:hypothetical protein
MFPILQLYKVQFVNRRPDTVLCFFTKLRQIINQVQQNKSWDLICNFGMMESVRDICMGWCADKIISFLESWEQVLQWFNLFLVTEVLWGREKSLKVQNKKFNPNQTEIKFFQNSFSFWVLEVIWGRERSLKFKFQLEITYIYIFWKALVICQFNVLMLPSLCPEF